MRVDAAISIAHYHVAIGAAIGTYLLALQNNPDSFRDAQTFCMLRESFLDLLIGT